MTEQVAAPETVAAEAPADPAVEAAPETQEAPATDSVDEGGREEAPTQSYADWKRSLDTDHGEEPEAGEEAREPVTDARGRVHDPETGQYLPSEGAEDAAPDEEEIEATDVAETPSAEGEETGEEPEATDEVPEGFTRFELPEDHPLRSRGRTHFEVRLDTPEAEHEFRSLLNDPVTQRQMQEARQTLETRENELVQTAAALRTAQEFNSLLLSNPRIIETHQQIREDQGDEAAQHWLRGLLQQQGQNASQYVEQARQHITQERQAQQVQAFVAERIEEGQKRYPEWSEAQLRSAVDAYGAYLEANGINDLDPEAFHRIATAMYVQEPSVQEKLSALQAKKAEEAEKKAREEAARKERERLEKATRSRRENPLSSVPASVNAGKVARTEADEPTSYLDFKRALSQ